MNNCDTAEDAARRFAKEVIDLRADNARMRAALQFIADHGGADHQTECGPISTNGQWCAEQARAALGWDSIHAQ